MTVRPDRGLAEASVTVAVPATVPGAIRESGVKLAMVTFATDASTVTLEFPLPPLGPATVAVMVEAPCATAVTKPLLEFTVANVGCELNQLVARPPRAAPETVLPAESFGVAFMACVWAGINETGFGVTVTDVMVTRSTVTADVPGTPSEVAVIVTLPVATPVTRPVSGSTVALDGSLLDQIIVRPGRTLPDASLVTAVKVFA